MSSGSNPIRSAISSVVGRVPSRKRLAQELAGGRATPPVPPPPHGAGARGAAQRGSRRGDSRRSRSPRPCPRGGSPPGTGCPSPPSTAPRTPRACRRLSGNRDQKSISNPSLAEYRRKRSVFENRAASAFVRASSSDEAEVLCVPAGLARDRVEQEGVDLGQRMVAREPPEGERQRRVAARVVQGVAGLVEERLVVVEAALGARDEVDDARRVGRDHAGARRLLWPVLEVGADPVLGLEVEAEGASGSRGTPETLAPSCRSPRAERDGGSTPCGRSRASLALGPRAAGRASARGAA